MTRDTFAHDRSQVVHHLWQIDNFIVHRNNLLKKAREWKAKGDIKKHNLIMDEVGKMKFQYQNTSYINYGYCEKLKKGVSFIPNVCQLETQNCFEHRRG